MIVRKVSATLFFILATGIIIYSQEKKDFISKIKKEYPNVSIVKASKLSGLYTLVPGVSPTTAEIKRYHEYLNYLMLEESLQSKIKGKATGGFNGDVAGRQELINVNSGLQLTKGSYKGEIGFKASIDMTVTNGTLQENLSNLELSYDHYVEERVQTFVYLKRFSDKFMNLNNRYEVGFGLVLEGRKKSKNLMSPPPGAIPGVTYKSKAMQRPLYNRVNKKGKLAMVEMEKGQDISDMNRRSLLSSTLSSEDKSDLIELINDQEDLQYERLHKNYRKFRHAWLFGVFAEVDQYTLADEILRVTSSGNEIPTDVSKTLDAETAGRIIVRPTFDWSGEFFKFQIRPYIKLPLKFWASRNTSFIPTDPNPDKGIVDQSSYDIRIENYVALTVTGGPVETTISYTHFFDNYNPQDYVDVPRTIDEQEFVMAPRHHHLMRISFSYKFN